MQSDYSSGSDSNTSTPRNLRLTGLEFLETMSKNQPSFCNSIDDIRIFTKTASDIYSKDSSKKSEIIDFAKKFFNKDDTKSIVNDPLNSNLIINIFDEFLVDKIDLASDFINIIENKELLKSIKSKLNDPKNMPQTEVSHAISKILDKKISSKSSCSIQ